METTDNDARRKPVSGAFTGFVFMLVGALCYVTIYYNFLVSETAIVAKIIISAVVLLLSFGTGCFIPSLRDSGFRYYMIVYENRKEAIKKAEQAGKKLKYPGKWQNFIYQTFRDGSVAEECSKSLRKRQRGETGYDFLEGCEKEQDAVNKHRNINSEIAVKIPKLGIKNTYHDCEKFQGLDTGFYFFSFLSLILIAVNLFLNYLNNYDFSTILPPVFSGLFFVIHKICKQKSKDMAHRYLTDINSGFLEIEAEEKRKKESVKVEVINSPGALTKVENITLDNSPVTVIGDNNKGDVIIGNNNKNKRKNA